MKIHSREKLVDETQGKLMDTWIEIRDVLTEAEELQVLSMFVSRTIGTIAKYAIRKERHGTTDKPGGLE